MQTVTKSFMAMLALPALLLTACGNNDNTSTDVSTDTSALATAPTDTSAGGTGMAGGAMATLNGTHPDTALNGSVRFQETGGRVSMSLDITVPTMANKSVAVHIHEHGSCGDMGKEAHGHWNPTKMQHGKWGDAQFHRGDIGNVTLDASGRGTMQLDTDLWSINDSDTARNIINKAIIVHSGQDDYKTQPTGNAGSRIGCGVITKM